MRVYETTFIINPQSDDATIEKHVSDIKDIILNTEGKIINENHMGTRRLAYEINKLTQGYYATFIYEAKTEVLPLLDHHFKVNDAFIRDLTVRIECDPQEYLKQQDPFGKHGSERPDRDHRGGRPSSHNADAKPAATEEKKSEEKAPVETAPVKTEPVKTEAKAESAEPENASKEDKPKDDKE